MATALGILTQALTAIGAYAQGESISAADSEMALTWFQNQIDAFNADRLYLNVQNRVTHTLTSGTSSQTIGSGGDIDTVRPVYITGINYLIPGTSPAVETPMGRMDDDSYMDLSIKGLSSNLPTQWYYNEDFPLGVLKFWPVVSQNVDIALYLPQPSITATTLQTTVVGPPGYLEAFIFQLALRLTLPFARPMPEGLPELAANALARAKRPNLVPGLLGVDAALVPGVGGGYNILNDSWAAGGQR